jgi:hypothetical protein
MIANEEKQQTMNAESPATSTLFLGHNVDWWNFWMVVSLSIAALAAAGVVLFTIGSLIVQKRDVIASSLALDRYKTGADERIAAANAIAAQANLETERLKKQLGWRDVTPEQSAALVVSLRDTPTHFVVHWGMGDGEASHFARRLAEMLQQAGWTLKGGNPIGQLGEERHGLIVAGSERADIDRLTAAFSAAGFGPVASEVVVPNPDGSPKLTDIFVGYREPPLLGTAPMHK